MSTMHTQDLPQNCRIARLAQLTLELEQCRTPEDTLRILERGFAEIDGFVASLLLSTRGLSPGHYRVVGAHLKDEPLGDLHSLAREEAGPVRRGGILGAIISRREPQLVQGVDWVRDPFFCETLKGYTSVSRCREGRRRERIGRHPMQPRPTSQNRLDSWSILPSLSWPNQRARHAHSACSKAGSQPSRSRCKCNSPLWIGKKSGALKPSFTRFP